MDLSQLEKLLAFKQSEELGEKLKPPQREIGDLGEVFTDGTMQASLLAQMVGQNRNQEAISSINKSLSALSSQIQEASKRGDLADLEQLLVTQAITLSNLSSHFMMKALCGLEDATILKRLSHLPEQLINASLRSQAESRKCIALLNEIKNPKRKAVFIKNQSNHLNIGEDHLQQLEAGEYEQISTMDARTQREAISIDSPVEALGEGDRAEVGGRKEASISKRQSTRVKKPRSRRDAAAD